MTDQIKRLIKKRKHRYDAWRKYGQQSDLAEYNQLKKEVSQALKRAHGEYVNNIFDNENGNSAKRLWGYVKSLKMDRVGIPSLIWENRLVTNAKQKAEVLSQQYKSVFTVEDRSSMPTKGHSNAEPMADINITTNGVEKLLNTLNPRKAVGPDQVSTWMLKNFSSQLAPVLKALFTQSLESGDVGLPTDWKSANVSATFKKGERSTPSNYRPVSLTSVTCKMLEHIIASNIRQHLDDHNILSPAQHGFRKKHSCETQLLTTIEDLARGLDQREQIDCLVSDFSKAFDCVAHQRLLYKMDWYGIRGETNIWIRNWLTSRTQTVVVDGERSEEAEVISGVPQGTVLGPLLFILYINDIGENTSSTIRLFADDCLIYKNIKSQSDAATLQEDLDTMVSWSKKWQMSFNAKKCTLLCVARKRNVISHTYKMLGTNLEQMEHNPYLGVELSAGLEWKHHVKIVSGRAHRTLNFLQRNMYRCPTEVRKQAYISLIRPTLEYASTCWDPYIIKHKSQFWNPYKGKLPDS